MINRVRQFIDITKNTWVSDALYRTIDFFANKASQKLISTSKLPDSPISIINKKILFIEAVWKLDWWGFGDGIFRSPIIDWLWANSHVHILTRDGRSPIFDRNPNVSELHVLEQNRTIWSIFAFINSLRNENFDHIIALHPTWKMHFFIYLIKTKVQSIHTSMISRDEIKTTNLIQLFLSKVQLTLGHIPSDKIPSPKIYPNESKMDFANIFDPNKKYIGVNIGAKSWLRNFREWWNVFEKLQTNKLIWANTVFVLVGKDGVDHVDEEIMKILNSENVINFCNKVTLAETYEIISYCNSGFIGMDWGNVNAAIALRHHTNATVIPIYNAVNPELRIPSDLSDIDCIDIPCPNGTNCFSENIATCCSITGQLADDNIQTPPCLQNSIASEHVYNWLLRLI